MKIKTKDTVMVISGKDKGKKGQVERIYRLRNKVLIKGVNAYKKHVRKSEQLPQGGVVELFRPLSISKVMLICSSCNKPTRVGFLVKNGKKLRICRKCFKQI